MYSIMIYPLLLISSIIKIVNPSSSNKYGNILLISIRYYRPSLAVGSVAKALQICNRSTKLGRSKSRSSYNKSVRDIIS
jgi:hypothetical protein